MKILFTFKAATKFTRNGIAILNLNFYIHGLPRFLRARCGAPAALSSILDSNIDISNPAHKISQIRFSPWSNDSDIFAFLCIYFYLCFYIFASANWCLGSYNFTYGSGLSILNGGPMKFQKGDAFRMSYRDRIRVMVLFIAVKFPSHSAVGLLIATRFTRFISMT